MRKAAKQAQIDHFIESNPQAIQFCRREGIRLVEGNVSVPGLPLRPYKQAMLVLMKPRAYIQSRHGRLSNLNHDLTIIMIAHRLSTLRGCDRIIRLAEGGVLGDGSPADVLKFK